MSKSVARLRSEDSSELQQRCRANNLCVHCHSVISAKNFLAITEVGQNPLLDQIFREVTGGHRHHHHREEHHAEELEPRTGERPTTPESTTGSSDLSCQFCAESFQLFADLKIHLRTEHQFEGSAKPYSCPSCRKRFLFQGPFKRHLALHSTLTRKKKKPRGSPAATLVPGPSLATVTTMSANVAANTFQPPSSEAVNKDTTATGAPLPTSSAASVEKPSAPVGEVSTKSPVNQFHKLVVENGCSVGNSSSKTPPKSSSTSTSRPGKLPYPCSKCNKKYSKLVSLKEHLTSVHGFNGKVSAFVCDSCGKKFTTRGFYLKHLEVHTANKPPSSSVTGSSPGPPELPSSSAATTNQFVCKVCSGTFRNLKKLKRHREKVHGKGRTDANKADQPSLLKANSSKKLNSTSAARDSNPGTLKSKPGVSSSSGSGPSTSSVDGGPGTEVVVPRRPTAPVLMGPKSKRPGSGLVAGAKRSSTSPGNGPRFESKSSQKSGSVVRPISNSRSDHGFESEAANDEGRPEVVKFFSCALCPKKFKRLGAIVVHFLLKNLLWASDTSMAYALLNWPRASLLLFWGT